MAELFASLRIRAFDGVTGVARRIQSSIRGITAAQSKAQSTFALAGQMTLAAQTVDRFSRAARNALTEPIDAFEEFEDRMASVRAMTTELREPTEAAGAKFDQLAKKARELGGTTRFTANEAAEGLKSLAISGFTVQEQLDGITPILDLAAASGASMGDASEYASKLTRGFGLEAKDMADVTDVLTGTFTNTTTTLQTLFEGMKMSAPVAKNLGMSIRDLSSITGILGSSAIDSSLAGTQMRMALNKLLKPSDRAVGMLKELDVELDDGKGNLRGFVTILEELQAGMARLNLGTRQRGAVLSEIFGARAITSVSVLLDKLPELAKLRDRLDNVTGETRRVRDIMDDTGKGAAAILNSALTELSITIGTSLSGEAKSLKVLLSEIVQGIADWVREHPRLTKGIMYTVAALAALVTLISGALFVAINVLAIKGILFLVGGFSKLAALIVGPFIAAFQWLLVWVVALAVKFLLLAEAAWAMAAPAIAAAAPWIGLALALGAVALGVYQLIRAFKQLEISKAWEGIQDFAKDEGWLATIGAILDPRTLINEMTGSDFGKGKIGGAHKARISPASAAGALAGTERVAGEIKVKIESDAPAKVTGMKMEGPIDLDVDAGLALAGSAL